MQTGDRCRITSCVPFMLRNCIFRKKEIDGKCICILTESSLLYVYPCAQLEAVLTRIFAEQTNVSEGSARGRHGKYFQTLVSHKIISMFVIIFASV